VPVKVCRVVGGACPRDQVCEFFTFSAHEMRRTLY
jgi:hypothetical protein